MDSFIEPEFVEAATFLYLMETPRPILVAGTRDEIALKATEAEDGDLIPFESVSRSTTALNHEKLAVRADRITGMREIVLTPVADRKAAYAMASSGIDIQLESVA
jgi:hypothetical protein